MKKLTCIAAASLLAVTSAFAYTEEVMVVTHKDGTTTQYVVNDVEKVSFGEVEYALDFTTATGDFYKYLTVPTVLRVQAAETGDPTLFGFGTVEASDAQGLCSGEFGVLLSVSAAKVYTGAIDLADEKSSYSLTLVKYIDGQSQYILTDVVEGSLITELNSKNQRVTLTLNATLADGTVVNADYLGRPTNVESLEAMVPDIKYGNEVFYYNDDLVETHKNVTKVTKSGTNYTFYFDGYVGGAETCTMTLPDALFTGEKIDAADATNWKLNLDYMWQLAGATGNPDRDKYSNVGNKGTFKLSVDEDGTYHMFIKIYNSYVGYSGANETPKYMIMNFDGTL